MLTDNEIIKALECCAKAPFCRPTTNCPYKCVDNCVERHALDAIDLINRQKAEIERLQNKVEELSEVLSDTIRIRYAECRAEAIKEVFEKLDERLFVHSFKTKSDDYTQGQVDCMDFVDSKIEELKKEMVGGNNE